MKILVFSDVHAGLMNPEQTYHILKVNIYDRVKERNDIDVLICDGDFFHTKLSLNSKSATLAIFFIQSLAQLCYEKNIMFRMIKGTKSHDFNQLAAFKSLETDNPTFKIVETFSNEMINGIKFTYIPEEYMEDADEYYKSLYEEGSDIIFGHGMFDFQSFGLEQESERPISNAPVFDSKKFQTLSKYGTYFGHIHKPCNNGRVHYVGSLYTNNFGEICPKSIMEICLDGERENILRIPTIDDFEYQDLKVSTLLQAYNNDIEKVSKFIENACTSKFVRVVIDTDVDPTITNILKKISLDQDNVSVKFKKKEIENRVPDEYNFLLSNDIDSDTKIIKFIKLKYGQDIPLELINSLK